MNGKSSKPEEIVISEKYKIVNNLSNRGRITAYRYNEPWRDLTGDNLILSMFYRIQELEEKVSEQDHLLIKTHQKATERINELEKRDI